MAVADTTPPRLTSLTFPTSYDGASAAAYRYGTFTAGAADDGTGVDHVTITLDRNYQGGPYSHSLTIGGPLTTHYFAEGPQSESVPINSFSPAGTYGIQTVAVYDKAGNVATYGPDQLAALGIATSFTVNGPNAGDSTAPTLTGLTLPSTVDVRGGSAFFQIGVAGEDAGSGVQTISFTVDHGVGTQTVFTTPAGTNSGSITLPSTAVPGVYHVTGAQVADQLGNIATYNESQIAALHIATTFDVVSDAAPDTTAPVLRGLTLASALDLTKASASLPVNAMVDESGSGLAHISIKLDHAVTLDIPLTYNNYGQTLSGPVITDTLTLNNVSGSIPASVGISAQTAAGSYNVVGVTLSDAAGNSSSYDAASLHALGIDTAIQIAADGTKPELTSFALPGAVKVQAGYTTSLSASDAGTGAAFAVIHFDRPVHTNQRSPFDEYHMPIALEGDAPGTGYGYTYSNTVAAGAGAGVYTVLDVLMTDRGGNSMVYTADQLRSLGFATSFHAIGSVAADVDASGRSDLLWRNDDGAFSTWSSAGGDASPAFAENTFYDAVATRWHLADTGDWNGDGRADLFWQKDDGALSVWSATGSGFDENSYFANVPSGWSLVAAGDINGDGFADLLWRDAGGALSTWLANGGSGFQQNAFYHGPVDSGWKVEGFGDFDGDGKADILWRNTNGAVSVWKSTGGAFQEGSFYQPPIDPAWHVVGVGDFNDDGRDDVLWRNDNGAITVWEGKADGSFDELKMEAYAATDWHVAAVGDYNGDNSADILWRNDGGAISIWNGGEAGWQENSYFDASVGPTWSIAAHHYVL